ncbi:hypothetical protein CORC01_05671, partial [Colletotrichum orchidophilum]
SLSAFVSFARSQSLKQTTWDPVPTHDRALRSPSLPSSSVALGKLLSPDHIRPSSDATTSPNCPRPTSWHLSRLPSRWNPAVTLQRRGMVRMTAHRSFQTRACASSSG